MFVSCGIGEEVRSIDRPTDHEVSVANVLGEKVEPQHSVLPRTYTPVIDFVRIADKVSVDAEIANSRNKVGAHSKSLRIYGANPRWPHGSGTWRALHTRPLLGISSNSPKTGHEGRKKSL